MHSFRTHVDGSITWTLKHAKMASLNARVADSAATELSKRKLRSRDRAIAHRELQQRAQDHRLRRAFQKWRSNLTPAPS